MSDSSAGTPFCFSVYYNTIEVSYFLQLTAEFQTSKTNSLREIIIRFSLPDTYVYHYSSEASYSSLYPELFRQKVTCQTVACGLSVQMTLSLLPANAVCFQWLWCLSNTW